MKLLLILAVAMTASAADVYAVKGCKTPIPTVDPWDGPARCLFVHLNTASPDADHVLVTFTYIDQHGWHRFQFDTVPAGKTTTHFWAPDSHMLSVQIEERDVNDNELTWQCIDLSNGSACSV